MIGDWKFTPIKSNSAVYSTYSTAFQPIDQKAVLHLLYRQLLEGAKPHISHQLMQDKHILYVKQSQSQIKK